MNTIKSFLIVHLIFISFGCSGIEYSKESSKFNAPFDGQRFNNIEPFEDKSFFKVLKWRLFSSREDWKEVKNQKFFKPSVKRSKELKLTMIGHSTVLIQVDNLNILTDPHYSERCSPISWAGPKRVIQPSIKFEDLPPIDIVLISHNHYDHLDLPTLVKLNKKFAPKFLVGLGNKELLESEDITNIMEMDWWEELAVKGMKFHFTPVQHWSARGIFDKRKTLWGGFYIKGSRKIFFAGDTGYGKVFKMINERYGNMEVGLLPIGAYAPRWFMKNAHVDPSDSVKIFRDLGLKKALGIHFATFNGLTDEAKDKPIEDLEKALLESQIDKEDFIAPEFGPAYSL